MFEAIKRKAKKIQKLNQHKMLDKILSDELLEAQIVDLNQKQLYEQGLQADGTPTGDYAPITIAYYKPLAAAEGRDGRSDHITGKDTGITYDSMTVEDKGDGIVIRADDQNDFFARIDKGLGLTGESKKEILPEIKQRLIEEIKTEIA